jgi:hypothetical protein
VALLASVCIYFLLRADLSHNKEQGVTLHQEQTILHSDITVNDRALEDDQHNANIAVKVAGFPPHANLARLLTVRTAFTDLTLPAYLKRTNFGPVTNRVQKYRCIA